MTASTARTVLSMAADASAAADLSVLVFEEQEVQALVGLVVADLEDAGAVGDVGEGEAGPGPAPADPGEEVAVGADVLVEDGHQDAAEFGGEVARLADRVGERHAVVPCPDVQRGGIERDVGHRHALVVDHVDAGADAALAEVRAAIECVSGAAEEGEDYGKDGHCTAHRGMLAINAQATTAWRVVLSARTAWWNESRSRPSRRAGARPDAWGPGR